MAETRAELLKEIKKLQSDLNQLEEKSNSLTEKQIKLQERLKSKIVERARELKELNSKNLSQFSSEESSMKSMSSMYDGLKNIQKQSLDITYKGQVKNVDKALEIFEINRSIAQLTPDDEYQRLELMGKRDALMESLDGRSRSLVNSLKEQNSLADSYANMTESQKRILQSQHDVLDGIRDTIIGTIETAITLYGNFQGALGGVVTGMGFVVDKIGQANRELGTTLFQTDGVGRKAGILSFIFEDAVGTAKNLSSELGSTDRATFGLQTNVGLMAMNMGISNSEAATLVGSFSRLNGNSTDVASDMIATSREFAKQNGIIPSQLMGDLAASAEEFALFGKQGGKNILEAAGYAAKLGVNMKTLSGISEGLLDFETSITKELELGAMLGRNINLNRARALAYEGNIQGAVKETLNALGGVEAFNRMDYFQKKQTADLLGVSVAELDKMVKYQEQAGTLGGVINEKFSKLGEFIDGGLNKYLGTSLKSLGGMITASAQVGADFAQMGVNVSGMAKNIPGIKKLFGGAATAAMPTPAAGGGIGKTLGSAGKGLGAGLKGVGSGLMSLAPAIPVILTLTAAIIGVGFALKLAAPGIRAFGEAVGSIVKSVGDAFVGIIGALGNMFTKISQVATPELALSVLGLSYGFAALTGSLAAFSIVGLAAIPAMAAVGAFAAIGGGEILNVGGDESLSEYNTQMLSKMDELIQVTKSAKDVYLDREKVTGLVISTSEKNSVNKFSLNNA